MKNFDSTQLKSGDWKGGTLTIQFTTGATYEYYEVPEDIWNGLCAAESAGKYFNQNVKGKYQYKKNG